MSEALLFIIGALVGGVLSTAWIAWGSVINKDRAVKFGIWTYEGKAYRLKEVEPNE